jgi:hypothetical protein
MKRIEFCLLGFFSIALMGLFFGGCDSNNDTSGTSRVTVRMVDAPGDYDEVNVEVLDVLIKDNSNADDQGWISIGDKTLLGDGKIVNLLDLTGGVSVLLADNLVPSGYLGQIRLLLGDENTLVKYDNSVPRDITKDIIYDLKTPSAQQSGLKLKVNQTLLAGATYDFLLDFDVERSVVKAGSSGIYNLHPVIRVSTKSTSGVIKGTVTPIGVLTSASVVVGGVTISTLVNETTGIFQLNGIPAGTYTVTLTPADPNSLYKVTTVVPDAVVVNGAIKDVGSQALLLKP